MNPRLQDFLTRLLDARGPSGFEDAASSVWRDEAREFATHVWSDRQGNSFASVGPDEAPVVMLAGHVDEIGLMVHYIDDDGYLFVRSIGGWDPQVLVGQRVEVMSEDGLVPGVIGRRAIHLIQQDERDKAVKLKDLWVDIGATDGAGARARVSIGDVAVIRSDTLWLGEDRLAARSIDDRAGAAVVLDAARRAAEKGTGVRVVAVATTQEEISFKSGGGARVSSYALDPVVAIAVDVTHATDHPHIDKKEHGDIRMGEGPVISRGAVLSPLVVSGLRRTAAEREIQVQWNAAPSSTGTDADSMYTSRGGVAAGLVSIPNRYMHSPNQLVDASDVEHTAELIASYVASLDPSEDFAR